MVHPRISIITPSFNQGHFIEETIQSVLNQNYPNLEYIIIDGGSTDNSVEIIKKYEKHLAYWVSEKDKGQSEAINKGLVKATGDIFNWLNSDDYFEPGTLQKVADMFSNPEIDVICGQTTIFNEKRSFIGEPSTGFDVEKNIIVSSRINQPATFFRMSIVRELGPLSNQLHYCMDLEWWMKYLFIHGHKRIHYTEDVLVNFREHEQSKTIGQADLFIEDQFALYSGILSNKNPRIKSIDGYNFNVDLSAVPEAFVFRLTNSLFYYYVVNYYGRREMKSVQKLLPFIMEEYLEPSERKMISKIKFRSKYFPKALFRFRGS